MAETGSVPRSAEGNGTRRRFIARSAALLAAAAGGSIAGSCAHSDGSYGSVQPAFLRMREADLRLITGERARAALGSSGTGSGTGCDGTTVHCCFDAAATVTRVGNGYVLEVPGGRHAIEVDSSS